MFKSVLDDVWFEKYRPTNLDEMILPLRMKKAFQKYIDNKSIPNLLFISPSPGTGKTTIAKILANEIDASILIVNGRMKGGIETIRNKIDSFSKNRSIDDKPKIVLIDEADGLSPEAQGALQNFIEEYINIVRFIFTANEEHVFNRAIKSRFQIIHFEVLEDEYQEMVSLFTSKVIDILTEESIEYDEKTIFKIVKQEFPDYRYIWQTLSTIYDNYGSITRVETASKKTIKLIISAMNKKDLRSIREVVKSSSNINYSKIYSNIMENVDELDYKMENAVFTLAEWDYKNKFVADKVLNFLGMCADMILNEE